MKIKFSDDEWNVLIRGVYLAHEENVRLAKTHKHGSFFEEQAKESKTLLDKITELYFENIKPKQTKTKKAK